MAKEDQIIGLLNRLIEGEADAFTIKKLKVEAEEIKKHNLPAAFSILGMIACIEKDVRNMHSYHKSALAYSEEGYFHLGQYVVSLMNCKLFQDAYTYALKAFEKVPTDLRVLDMLIRAINELGIDMEDEFQKYIEKWFELKGQPHKLVTFPEDNDEHLSKTLDKFDVLLKQPTLVLKPNAELIKKADSLVEGVEFT